MGFPKVLLLSFHKISVALQKPKPIKYGSHQQTRSFNNNKSVTLSGTKTLIYEKSVTSLKNRTKPQETHKLSENKNCWKNSLSNKLKIHKRIQDTQWADTKIKRKLSNKFLITRQ
jgi:hypothetical protein